MDIFHTIGNLKDRVRRWCKPYKLIRELIIERACATIYITASMSAILIFRSTFRSLPWIDFMVKKHPRIWVLTASSLFYYSVKKYYEIDAHHIIKHVALDCLFGLSLTIFEDDKLDTIAFYSTATVCSLLFLSHLAFMTLFSRVFDTIFKPPADTAIANRGRLSRRTHMYAMLFVACIEMGCLITFSAKAVPKIRSMSMMKLLRCIKFF